MKLYRIILQNKEQTLKQIPKKVLLGSVEENLFKFPIFIGTLKQWNNMVKDLEKAVEKQ